jgi:hypothetical protein
VIADLVVAHLGRYGLVKYRECAAHAAAFIRPRRRDELDPLDLGKQIHRLGEERFIELGRFGMLEPAQRHAFVVEPDAVREPRPWKRVDLEDIVQELDELQGAGAHLLDLFGLLDGVETVAYKVDAATLGRHDVIEAGEVAHEQRFRGGGLGVEAGIGHRLPAAGLVARLDDLAAKPLQRRDPNFREEGVDETGDEQADAHVAPPLAERFQPTSSAPDPPSSLAIAIGGGQPGSCRLAQSKRSCNDGGQ